MTIKSNTEEFIAKARKVHGDKYDYSLVVYTVAREYVDVICKQHNYKFATTANNHLNGKGCRICRQEKAIRLWSELKSSERTLPENIQLPKGTKAVPLTKGKYAIVDKDDYERVMEYNWYCNVGYAWGTVNKKTIGMHRFITGLPISDKRVVDHINHDRLDNRKSNLRICTQGENQANTRKTRKGTSIYKGVSVSKLGYITATFCRKHIGNFKTEEEAAKAYDREIYKKYGDFALLNFKNHNHDKK